jgi:hypothetical protein
MRIMMAMLVFVVSVTIVCGAVIVIARQVPLPRWLTALHFEMCEPPCWIGIQPGVTTLDEAIERVRSAYSLPDYVIKDSAVTLNTERIVNVFAKGEHAVTVTFYLTDYRIVNAIDFYLAQSSTFLGKPATYADIHGFLGVPSYMSIQSWYGDTLISYPSSNGRVNVMSWASRDRSHREYENKNLQRRSISRLTFSKDELPIYRGPVHVEWRGFLSLAKYKYLLCLRTGCD